MKVVTGTLSTVTRNASIAVVFEPPISVAVTVTVAVPAATARGLGIVRGSPIRCGELVQYESLLRRGWPTMNRPPPVSDLGALEGMLGALEGMS